MQQAMLTVCYYANFMLLLVMSTGDLKNNLRKLQSALRAVKYNTDVEFERYMQFLRCISFAFFLAF